MIHLTNCEIKDVEEPVKLKKQRMDRIKQRWMRWDGDYWDHVDVVVGFSAVPTFFSVNGL